MTQNITKDLFKMDIDTNSDSICFIGVFPNHVSMFGFFANSVGVSNVVNFINSLKSQPGSVAKKPSGIGFAGFSGSLLEAKKW
jgi:hypothetical protein